MCQSMHNTHTMESGILTHALITVNVRVYALIGQMSLFRNNVHRSERERKVMYNYAVHQHHHNPKIQG